MSRESRMELIRRRGRNEHQTLIKKFLDPSKESLRRLKALKNALERTKPEEVKEFFNTYASVIFYVVYTSFTTCEDAIQNQKGKKTSDAARDLTDLVLPTLEETMITLPELVRKQWQSNSICLIIRKLLHPQNHLPIRCCGIRLLVIWLQCLQGNGSSACLELFASAVPGFPPVKTQHVRPDDSSKHDGGAKQGQLSSSQTMFELKLGQQYGPYLSMSMPSLADPPDVIGVIGLRPLSLIPHNDGKDGSVTVELMRYLLECLTTQVGRLKWDACSDHMRGFSFLFMVYKLLYLSAIYKGFHMGAGLYSLSPAPVLACAQREATPHDHNASEGSAMLPSVLKKQLAPDEPSSDVRQPSSEERWDALKSSDASQMAGEQLASTHSPLAGGEPLKTQDNSNAQYPVVYQLAALIEDTSDLSNPIYQRVKQLILEFVLQWLMAGTSPSKASTSGKGPQTNINGVELMKRMLMSSRDNVNLLLEILKQGFVDESFSNDHVLRNLISVYNKWMTTPERPVFMMPPAAVGEESRGKGNAMQLEVAMDTIDVQPWEALSSWGVPYDCDVRAGLQPSLHMCVDHTSKMFFTRAKDRKAHSVQVDLCKRIIRLYQDIVTAWLPDKDTWSYILAVLLHLAQELLNVPHAKRGKGLGDEQSHERSLGDDLASELLKTLLLCFVRASLVVQVSSELWDSLLYVMSSLTGRREAILQWKAVMDTMTHILAFSVYNLNLHNLPLNKAKEDKHRPRSSTVIPSETAARNTTFSKVNFFRSPAQVKLARAEGLATSTPTRPRPTSIRPSRGMPSPIVSGPAKTLSAPAEADSDSPPQPQPSEPPVSATAHSTAMFDTPAGLEYNVIMNPHVLCLSPDPRPSFLDDGDTYNNTGALVVKNVGCQEADPVASLGAHVREPSGLEQDSDWETKSNSSSAVLVVAKLPLRDSTPPLTSHPQTDPSSSLTNHQRGEPVSPTTDHPTSDDHAQLKVRTPSPSGKAVARERSASSTSSSSLVDIMAPSSAAAERGGTFLSKACSEGNLLGSSIGLLHQGKSTRPLLEVGSSTKQHQHQHVPGIRRVVSTDVAHRSMEAVNCVREMQPGVDSFCMFLREEDEAQANAGGTAMRQEPWSSGDGVLPWMRESSRFTQNPSWSQVLAAVVWQRMLKILGDINKIADPLLHVEAMSCLQSIWKSLFDIEANLGVSQDSQPPGELPTYTPPLLLIFPWVVKACSLPDTYTDGRRVAYELLCSLVIKHSHTPCSLSYLAHFYRLMHDGLCGGSVAVRNVAVKSGCKLFSHGCVGSTVLLSDCVSACAAILNSKSTGSVPRMEALSLLGSTLYLPELYPTVCTLQSGVVETSCIKEQIVNTVLMAARQEPTRSLRCFAIHLLGILMFKELHSGQLFSRCDEAMDILFASLQFADHGVALSAVDMLSLLREAMKRLCPLQVSRVVEALCAAAAVCMGNKEQHQTVTPILLCLRDWFMLLPSLKEEAGWLHPSVVTTVFEVLHIATAGAPFQQSRSLSQRLATSCSISCTLDPITASLKSPQSSHKGVDGHQEVNVRIQMAARSVLTHLLNLFGHFPFGCGAAQLTSVVEEYHDSPSLDHLSELSSEVFDSPRVQFFALNKSSVITLVEIPTKLEGIPEDVMTSTYQTRVIVRDVSGKYCWDSAILYGGNKPYEHVESTLPLSEDTGGAVKRVEVSSESTGPSLSPIHPTMDTPQPLSWKSHQGDMLHDLLKHIESTSPECVIYPGNSLLTDPAPAETEYAKDLENRMLTMLEKYDHHELSYAAEAFTASSMCGDRARPPEYMSGDTIQFQHCRVFLSHLGMLSWSKRNHLDLLKKDNQLILELRNLDQAHSRQTYKVAVLYVALGQEDKRSILRNTCGSREFEDFVAGLGWEVDLKTHAGYLGGLKKEFYTSCTLPYYATSSEEVLFHVATRMPSKKPDDDTKVRHLGNDEVHIVWSEHWRDYRRTIFKTQFADVVIVIYPQPSGLYRIQIDSKQQGVSPFGPLFDGALVDRSSLPILVRATAINILRAQRHPTMSYRRRYEERMKYIQTVIDQNLIKSSYEQFAQNVMHPLSFDELPKQLAAVTPRAVPRPLVSPVELRVAPRLVPSDGSPAPSQTDAKRSSVTKISSLFSARRNGSSKVLSDRPESETLLQLHRSTAPGDNRCDDPGAPTTTLQRNHSVPENLSEMETLVQPQHVRSPSVSSQFNLHKNMS